MTRDEHRTKCIEAMATERQEGKAVNSSSRMRFFIAVLIAVSAYMSGYNEGRNNEVYYRINHPDRLCNSGSSYVAPWKPSMP